MAEELEKQNENRLALLKECRELRTKATQLGVGFIAILSSTVEGTTDIDGTTNLTKESTMSILRASIDDESGVGAL